MVKAVQDLSTRERLLDEAEFLFAEKGFHAVTIRAVTRAPACNLAAVNYHFGNKTKLYREVFRTRWAGTVPVGSSVGSVSFGRCTP